MSTQAIEEKKTLERKDLMKTYFRHYQILGCFNYERQQSNTFCYLMMPVLKKLYPDTDKFKESMKRHLAFFNCATSTSPFIIGITCAMEEQYANSVEDEFDAASINSVKTALMGPMAGIGDSMFWGTLRMIGVGVGAPLAVEGNIAGPILYVLINFIPSTFVRYYGFWLGYRGGREFLTRISGDGTLDRFTEAARVLGLVVVGSMIVTMVKISTPLSFALGETNIEIQAIFNSILPSFLPLCTVALFYRLMNKGVSGTKIMLVAFLVGIIGKLIGIL